MTRDARVRVLACCGRCLLRELEGERFNILIFLIDLLLHEGDLSFHSSVLVFHDIHLELELVLLLHELLLLHGISAPSVVRHEELLDSLAFQLRQLWALMSQRLVVDRVDTLVRIGKSDVGVGRRAILHLKDVRDNLSAAGLPVLLRRLVCRVLLHSVLRREIDVARLVRDHGAPLLVLLAGCLVLDRWHLVLGRR